MKTSRTFKAILVGRVPGWAQLVQHGYGWLDDFLEVREIESQLVTLRARRAKVENAPVDPAEFRATVLADYDRRREALVNSLAAHLGEYTAPGTQRLALAYAKTRPLPPRDLLEEALSRVSIGEGLTAGEREFELATVDQLIQNTEARLQELNRAEFAVGIDGDKAGDLRKRFVEHWQRIQGKVNAPCSPRGVVLTASSEEEQEAWSRLGLFEFVNEESDREPDPGPQF